MSLPSNNDLVVVGSRPTLACTQHYHRSRVYRTVTIFDWWCILRLDDIAWKGQGRVDKPAPMIPSASGGKFEFQRLPVCVDHEMNEPAAPVTRHRQCYGAGIVIPVRLFNSDAMPFNSALIEPFDNTHGLGAPSSVQAGPQVGQVLDETQNVRMLLRSDQSNHATWLSWQYALLFLSCVRRTSSLIRIIGVPAASSVTARKFFTCRLGVPSISWSSVIPATPQFQLMLSSDPSRLSSPCASLCFWL